MDAFFSYTPMDDRAMNGTLSEIGELLEAKISSYWGRDLRLWREAQDEDPLEAARSGSGLGGDAAPVFIPVLSPCFMRSSGRRHALDVLIRRNDAAGRPKLIFPVVLKAAEWMGVDEDRIRYSPLSTIRESDWADWRDFRRVRNVTDMLYEEVDRFAEQIGMRLEMQLSAAEGAPFSPPLLTDPAQHEAPLAPDYAALSTSERVWAPARRETKRRVLYEDPTYREALGERFEQNSWSLRDRLFDRTIYLLDDEIEYLRPIIWRLEQAGARVIVERDLGVAQRNLRRLVDVDVFLVDAGLAGGGADSFLARARVLHPEAPLFVMAGHTGEQLSQMLGRTSRAPILNKYKSSEEFVRELAMAI